MIGIVNYGLGNVQAIINIYKNLGIDAFLASDRISLSRASKIILPGVGSFDWAIKSLNDSGMRSILEDMVIDQKVPVLGICVGMQMMADSSEEGSLEGLGWIPGNVKKLEEKNLALPHMGWNDAQPKNRDTIFRNFEEDCQFYFLHSFHFLNRDPQHTLSTTVYGQEFSSSLSRDNIYAVQFHPEKSHKWGIQLLSNFAGLE